MRIVVIGSSLMMAVVEQELRSLPAMTVQLVDLLQVATLHELQPEVIVLEDHRLAQSLNNHRAAPTIICLDETANYEYALVHGVHHASAKLTDLLTLIQRSLKSGTMDAGAGAHAPASASRNVSAIEPAAYQAPSMPQQPLRPNAVPPLL